jgi:integrase
MGVKLRERKLESGRVSLYLDIYHKGKRSYEFLDLYLTKDRKKNKEKKRLAEAIRSKREVQLYNDQYDFEKKDDDLYLTDFMQQIGEDKSKSSNKNVNSVLKHLRDYDKEHIRFNDLSGPYLEGFKSYLLNKVKKSTARTYFLVLRSILNKATSRGMIKGNPLTKNEIDNVEKDPAKINYLNEKELDKLWKTDIKNMEVKRAFLFSVYTGLRLSDIITLKWDDIQEITDNDTGQVYKQVEVKQKKTSDIVRIPLSKHAEPLLEVPRRISENVFDVTEFTLRYWIPIWREKAEIKKHIHFHMARHTFATRLIRRDVDVYKVSKMMGHSSVSSTEKYLHLANSDLRKAIDKL